MKLATILSKGSRYPCLVDCNGDLRDVSSIIGSWYDTALSLSALNTLISDVNLTLLPKFNDQEVQFLAPIQPKQIISIGLNYRKHAQVAGLSLPKEPIISCKSIGSVCGPTDPVLIPTHANHVDWEVELGVVIGETCQLLESEQQAHNSILGYCVANDFSDRQWLLEREGEWVKGKSFQSFCPLGPYVVTADSFSYPLDLTLTCYVNGVLRQNGSTTDMVFTPAFLVHYVSQFMTLYPGDVILTGSPDGISLGNDNIPYLKPGDRVTTHISQLGYQEQLCQRYPQSEDILNEEYTI
ncbi:2-hydroxyhepta-2,4-diene-1,7-dioate isomerase [Pseudoalteromonas sp. A22]|uniref:Fumarylacetoacetate hydrolase family protein n=1 Tax=Pseudoalteromonas maricaloris TaxID=184924 RepID=A0A8I2H595_9GAMM|nr:MULTISPECIES: fumarylacetoacetate hydrolase family protein [Pseudoalteromonas]NLR21479.1 fumarylacetoacetate hydrolase family protein [Pseudoalteromonas maricaloris]QUI63256.1 2-hydroxyhepta-2,4-diene-1,7-dioate isomerase [Pseudoalteromonas sp. A22]WMO13875.1 fumarylacetoacetate hydrolase family protein [Pseudoalteromonas piscicida]WOX30155.1 fumarylacetoacetate hydrolase family protein [Pseudoalteromonas maricaloris]